MKICVLDSKFDNNGPKSLYDKGDDKRSLESYKSNNTTYNVLRKILGIMSCLCIRRIFHRVFGICIIIF